MTSSLEQPLSFEMVVSDAEDYESEKEEEQNKSKEELEIRIYDVFRTFDEDADGCLEPAEIGSVMRCLGFNVSQSDLEEICEQFEKTNDVIPFEPIYHRILQAIGNEEWPMDTEQTLRLAFETIAEVGIVSRERFIHLMTSSGEPLSATELKHLISHLPTKKNGEIDWKMYISEVNRHIHEKQ